MGLQYHLRTGTDQLPVRQDDPALHDYGHVCAAFSVGQSTASAKARVVSDALHAHRMDLAWMLPSLVDQSPLVWMAKVKGALVDLRDMPRELQVVAYEKGIIPYVPADKE